MPAFNIYLQQPRDAGPKQGGLGAVENYDIIDNIVCQTRSGPPSDFEEKLAAAVEQAFLSGVTDLEGLVEFLNTAKVHDGQDAAWTAGSLTACLEKLGDVA